MSSEGGSAELKIGRTLELARKERGLSLKQVEQATKIRARYLEELERENFGVLPAVYVQGSLKTYANFLHLDGEALVRELRRQQSSQHEPQDPVHAEPPRGDYFDRSLIFFGGAAGAESQENAEDEEDAGAASVPLGGNLTYLASAAFLVLILVAVALALTLPRESQPELSQIREPLISDAPSQMSGLEGEENTPARPQHDDGEQRTDDKDDNPQPDKHAGARDDGEPAQTLQDQAQLAQGTPAATATPSSASPTPQVEPPPAQPEAPPTPPRAPDGGGATGAPVSGGGAAPQPAARGTGGPANALPRPGGGGPFNVQVVPGSDDLVRITGSPIND